MKKWYKLAVLLTVWTGFSAVSSSAAGPAAADITRRMNKQIGTVTSLSADYSISMRLTVLDKTRETSGHLNLIRKQNKLRLEQADQTIVSDGSSVWTYAPSNRQIIVTSVNQTTWSLRPDDFLFRYTERHTATLMGEESIDGVLHYVLKLTAKEPSAGPSSLKIWVDGKQWLTRKVVLSDDSGSETTIRFTGIRINPVLPATLFTMTVPQGVEVVDLR